MPTNVLHVENSHFKPVFVKPCSVNGWLAAGTIIIERKVNSQLQTVRKKEGVQSARERLRLRGALSAVGNTITISYFVFIFWAGV